MPDPSRNPMTPKEVEELLKATLHGPLPQATVYRMMATLADWKGLAEARNKVAVESVGDDLANAQNNYLLNVDWDNPAREYVEALEAALRQVLAILNSEYSDKTIERKVYPLERRVISLGLDLEKARGNMEKFAAVMRRCEKRMEELAEEYPDNALYHQGRSAAFMYTAELLESRLEADKPSATPDPGDGESVSEYASDIDKEAGDK